MDLQNRELRIAVKKASITHPRLNLRNSRRFLNLLIENLKQNNLLPVNERDSFENILRNTLNQCELKQGDGREAYKALTGYYYGNRGNKVARKRRRLGLPPKRTFSPPPLVVEDSNGQLGWRI